MPHWRSFVAKTSKKLGATPAEFTIVFALFVGLCVGYGLQWIFPAILAEQDNVLSAASDTVLQPTSSELQSILDSLVQTQTDRGVRVQDSSVPALNETQPVKSYSTSENRAGSQSKHTTKITAGTININSASKEQLMRLPGVGDKTADKIIMQRQNRLFARPEDIMLVQGIGEKKFEKMHQYIRVRD